MHITAGRSFELDLALTGYNYIRLPFLGSVLWERDSYAKWGKVENEKHIGEIELWWGRWRFVVTSCNRLSHVASINMEAAL